MRPGRAIVSRGRRSRRGEVARASALMTSASAHDSDESPIEHDGQVDGSFGCPESKPPPRCPIRGLIVTTGRVITSPTVVPTAFDDSRAIRSPLVKNRCHHGVSFSPPLANDQIAVADDTDEMSSGVDDRQATYSVLPTIRRAVCGSVSRAHRDHVARHDVSTGTIRLLARPADEQDPRSILRSPPREHESDGARRHARRRTVGATREHDRHARAEDDPGRLRLGQVFELLGEHVARLEIGHHQDRRRGPRRATRYP